jgi:hypothetical protein
LSWAAFKLKLKTESTPPFCFSGFFGFLGSF